MTDCTFALLQRLGLDILPPRLDFPLPSGAHVSRCQVGKTSLAHRRKPYALIEVKLSARDVDPSLLYFAERLKLQFVVQVVPDPDGFKSAMTTSGAILTPASEFLVLI